MTAPYTELGTPMSEHSLVCRGCLADSGEMKNINEWGLGDVFYKFTDVRVQNSDSISVLLCTTCEDTLMTCKKFRSQCQQSDLLLRNIVKKKSDILTKADDDNTNKNTVISLLKDKELIIAITAPDTEAKVKLSCPHQCGGCFMKKKDLLLHLVKNHDMDNDFNIEIKYYCSIEECSYHSNSGMDKWFSARKFLNQHYNKVHKSKIFLCDFCNSKFSTNSAFNRHLKSCNVTYECQVCNKQYKNNEQLLVHLMRKHPDLHKQYKNVRKAEKRKSKTETETKKVKTEIERFSEYICDSPKRSFATQTLKPEENIKNDVTLPSWQPIPGKSDVYGTKTDEISTQTVFEDLLSLKSQTSEDDSIFFSETVSLSDIQTQTFPLEFGLSRSNKETITSETQSPDLSIKETQTCICLYDSPKPSFRLFDSVSSSPISINLTSTETQTADFKSNLKSDVLLSFNSTETQTCFDDDSSKDSL